MRNADEHTKDGGASTPQSEWPTSDAPPDCRPRTACIYRAYHRAIWPRLLCTPWADCLVAEADESWRALWGRLGAEFFRCFALGDRNIRRDMILRARKAGANEVVAKLDRWRVMLERGADR